MTAPDLPTVDQIQRIARAIGENEFHSWDDLEPDAQGRCVDAAVRALAALAEAGYVLVLAPDEATVERLAEVLLDQSGYAEYASEKIREIARDDVRIILAALADTKEEVSA